MLICMQNINPITQLFLRILQRNSKLVVLCNLRMTGKTHLKRYYKCEETFYVIFPVFLEILLKHTNSFFWIPWSCLTIHTHPECYYQLVENVIDLLTVDKLFYLSAVNKSTLSPMFFRRYCKDMKTIYFEYFEHVWLRTPKLKVATGRKLQYLSACQN